jgi:hypothetical protein
MVVTFVITMIVAFMPFAILAVIVMALMEDFRLFPRMALTGNSSEEQTGGKQVKGFHLRRV